MRICVILLWPSKYKFLNNEIYLIYIYGRVRAIESPLRPIESPLRPISSRLGNAFYPNKLPADCKQMSIYFTMKNKIHLFVFFHNLCTMIVESCFCR